jgi:hypothetical protein
MRFSAPILAAALFSLGISAAKADSVVIDFTWYDGSSTGVVSFTGTPDVNGNINLGDLTDFSLTDDYGQSFGLSALDAFGTFNSPTETWYANAPDWYGHLDAYITSDYGGGANSWSFAEALGERPTYTVVSDTGSGTAVTPEPGTLSLLWVGLLGLIALGATRRKAISAA